MSAMRKLKQFRLPAAVLVVVVAALVTYLLRGGFRRFEITPYPVPTAAFTNWNDVLAHPRDISLTTFQTGVVHMDACLNLDPASPRQADCDHAPRDFAVLVHWVHHPRMKLFNWINGITNRQDPGQDLRAQLARFNVHPKATFFTHFHPDHTGALPALGPQTEFIFGKAETSFIARAIFLASRSFQGSIFRPRRPWRLSARALISLATDHFGRSRFPVTRMMTSRI